LLLVRCRNRIPTVRDHPEVRRRRIDVESYVRFLGLHVAIATATRLIVRRVQLLLRISPTGKQTIPQ